MASKSKTYKKLETESNQVKQSSGSLTTEKLGMTYQELAAALSLTVSALRCMVHRKQIPYTKLGHRLRFIPADIQAWLKEGSHNVSRR